MTLTPSPPLSPNPSSLSPVRPPQASPKIKQTPEGYISRPIHGPDGDRIARLWVSPASKSTVSAERFGSIPRGAIYLLSERPLNESERGIRDLEGEIDTSDTLRMRSRKVFARLSENKRGDDYVGQTGDSFTNRSLAHAKGIEKAVGTMLKTGTVHGDKSTRKYQAFAQTAILEKAVTTFHMHAVVGRIPIPIKEPSAKKRKKYRKDTTGLNIVESEGIRSLNTLGRKNAMKAPKVKAKDEVTFNKRLEEQADH